MVVHVAPGDAFEAAAVYEAVGHRFDVVNLSNIADYAGPFACLGAFLPLLRTPGESVLQLQAMLGTHASPTEWVERQSGGAFSVAELDALLGLESQEVRGWLA